MRSTICSIIAQSGLNLGSVNMSGLPRNHRYSCISAVQIRDCGKTKYRRWEAAKTEESNSSVCIPTVKTNSSCIGILT